MRTDEARPEAKEAHPRREVVARLILAVVMVLGLAAASRITVFGGGTHVGPDDVSFDCEAGSAWDRTWDPAPEPDVFNDLSFAAECNRLARNTTIGWGLAALVTLGCVAGLIWSRWPPLRFVALVVIAWALAVRFGWQ